MEAFDTNVVVRLLVRDDEDQYRRAEVVLRRVTAGPGAWLSNVVLAEVAWVSVGIKTRGQLSGRAPKLIYPR